MRTIRVVAGSPERGVRTTFWQDDQNPAYVVPVATIRYDSVGSVVQTIRIVVEGECPDSIDIRIEASFEQLPDSIRVRVEGSDVTAKAGASVELPFRVFVRSTRTLPTSVTVGFSWHRSVFFL
ncbi:hypothetical protein, partial [Aphanothece microscopica]|uniref:hypothetical protein n=1 Tax=Aphanothece microscopica TaxID=1049561 RepID=UPI003984B71F